MDDICNGDDRNNGNGVGGDPVAARAWHHHSSRICRVSRASGGKDRHSKVLTAKGLRDRRVRLSVSTAIQFYDLQDRLGVDQPSKAVEWLIKAASTAIADLPALDGPFPDPLAHFAISAAKSNGCAGAALEDKETRPPPKRKRGGGGEDDYDGNDDDDEELQQQQNQKTRSGCSSTSDTSKGSVLSLSRSEIRVKARERAKERASKEKDKRDLDDNALQHGIPIVAMSHNPNSQSSFTELLTGLTAGGGTGAVTLAHPNHGVGGGGIRHLPSAAAAITTADYFGQIGFLGQGHKPPQHPHGFSSQVPSPFGNSSPIRMLPFNASAVAAAAASSDHSELQQQQHHISFLQDHFIPVAAAAAAGGDYSLNFSISSGLAGFNRGTLQSNSPTAMPHHNLQRLSSSSASSPHHQDGSNLPFFLCPSAVAAPASSAQADNHFHAGVYDGRLQLCYDDGYRHSDLKGKGKG